MRKKQKEGEASGDENKDADDAADDKQKKSSSPAREGSSPQYLDSASGPPPGYCTDCICGLCWHILNQAFSFILV